MYIKFEEIGKLLTAIINRFGRCVFIFDVYSRFTSKRIQNHPVIKRTGAKIYWGIDDPEDICKLDNRIRYVKDIYLTSNEEIKNLGLTDRLAYGLAHIFPAARNAQRIMLYETGRHE
jgi:O-methyltransferase involved in polyketide biosynthesis